VVQIQNYKHEGKDRNPYNHTAGDRMSYINPDYFLEQVRATVLFAARLVVPLMPAEE
jgi:hypothetical protein